MTKSLESLRDQINTTDRQIYDLLVKRAAIAKDMGAAKRTDGIPVIHPALEAKKIRDLLGSHSGDMPALAVARIWREMISASAMIQEPFKVGVIPTLENYIDCRDCARDYFGSVVPLVEQSNVLSAVSAVREGTVQFAVMPWPHDESENPWWAYLEGASREESLNILVRLPYVDSDTLRGHIARRTLVIGRTAFSPSGKDHSFLTLDLDQTVSRARVIDKAKALDMNVVGIFSKRPRVADNRSLHLIEVDQYVARDDSRLTRLLDGLESPEGRCTVIGGYPVMPEV
jgi:chorismate mutase